MSSNSIINPSLARIRPLDGLRGVAVLLVLGFHLINNQLSPMDPSTLTTVQGVMMKATYFGWCGVDLFFILSGFLIGSILLNNLGSKAYFKTFYIRRFLRILPIYYLLLVLFLIITRSPLYDPEANIFHKPIPLGYYFVFFQNWVMGSVNHFGPEALTPTWSLAIEEQFYLIIPTIIMFFRGKKLTYVLLAMILVSWTGRYLAVNWYQEYTFLTSRLDSPAIGVLCAQMLRNEELKARLLASEKLFQYIGGGFMVLSGLLYALVDVGVFNHTIIALNFALVVVFVVLFPTNVLSALLSGRILVWVGARSYFIYLFHQLINGVLHLRILGQRVPVYGSGRSLAVTVAALAITFLLAEISWQLIEKNAIQFSHRFKY